MPGGDGTGPMGRGSMTGWGRDFCGEPEAPQFKRGGFGGRGTGNSRGYGVGWGRRNRFRAADTPGRIRGAVAPPDFAEPGSAADTELQWLERRYEALKAEQQQIKARLDQLVGEQTD